MVTVGSTTNAAIPGLVPGAEYFFAAMAVDSAGMESVFSNEVSYQVPLTTTPPTIALTSPVNGATCTAPGTMTLAASVTANSHTITQVQFYNGTTMLGASTSAPYTMTWNNVSAGSYSLTAQAVYDSGSTVVSSAVNVTVTAPPPSGGGVLFSDNFSAGLSPWVSKQGTWTVAGGALKGSSTVDDYGTAYYNTNGWSNYTYQASIRFSISNGAYGGGIGGRLNAANGAHYTAWVFPEGSSGGSCVIKLMKFTGWTTWTGTAMGQASLSSVGTNWHTVALAFQGAGITVSYDGVQKISVTDNSFGSVAPYSTGGITADLGTYPTAFTLFVSNVSVTAPTGATQAAGVPLVRRLNGAGSTVVSPPLNVKVVDLPAPWQTADIGSVGVAGSASVSKAIYTVNGAGTISGTADSFRFVYQRLSGNGELTVRLNPAENKGSGRFGVMVRESLTKGSEYAFLGISPDGTLRWQGRSKTGGSTLSAASTIGAQQSVWVRIVRTGNVLYGYQSTDGTHWTKVNSQTITMATQVYAGLAVASGSAETLSAATFANVTVVP
jgi:regulation of enolase protein 1 (concanavalin A-like superfamily)